MRCGADETGPGTKLLCWPPCTLGFFWLWLEFSASAMCVRLAVWFEFSASAMVAVVARTTKRRVEHALAKICPGVLVSASAGGIVDD